MQLLSFSLYYGIPRDIVFHYKPYTSRLCSGAGAELGTSCKLLERERNVLLRTLLFPDTPVGLSSNDWRTCDRLCMKENGGINNWLVAVHASSK